MYHCCVFLTFQRMDGRDFEIDLPNVLIDLF